MESIAVGVPRMNRHVLVTAVLLVPWYRHGLVRSAVGMVLPASYCDLPLCLGGKPEASTVQTVWQGDLSAVDGVALREPLSIAERIGELDSFIPGHAMHRAAFAGVRLASIRDGPVAVVGFFVQPLRHLRYADQEWFRHSGAQIF